MPQKPMQMLNSFLYTDVKQKLRFGLVGGINTVSAYLAFIAIYHLSDRYIVSSILSYLVGMLVSYTLNRSFVFKSDKKAGQFIPFCLVNLTSLGCSTAVLYVLVQYGGFVVYFAQVLAIGVSMVVNYLGYQKVFTQGVSMRRLIPFLVTYRDHLDYQQLAKWGIFGLLLAMTLYNVQMSVLSDIAHDALPYMSGYSDKFVSEGRWINFALFYSLKAVPSYIAVVICNLSIFYFGYRLSLGVRKDVWLALCFGLLILNVPYFTMLFKWPMTLIPGCLMLALFAYMKDKLNPYALLIVSGILLFATYPAFYFLMPLLFLSTLRNASYPSMIKFLLMWALGYVLGYVVANGLVYAYTYLSSEHASFIHFANWRRSTPSTSLSSLLDNILKSAGNFERNALYISDLSPWFYLPIAMTVIWALKQHLKYTLIVILVVLSIYASVVPLGVTVPLRSGITLPIGLGVMLLLIEQKIWRGLVLLSLFIPLSYQMHDYNYGYTQSREAMARIMGSNDTHGYLKQPERFEKVLVSVDEPKMSQYMYQLTESNAFNVPSNLRYHFIKPYLYKRGWSKDKIEVINDPRVAIQGETSIQPKGKTLFVRID